MKNEKKKIKMETIRTLVERKKRKRQKKEETKSLCNIVSKNRNKEIKKREEGKRKGK